MQVNVGDGPEGEQATCSCGVGRRVVADWRSKRQESDMQLTEWADTKLAATIDI